MAYQNYHRHSCYSNIILHDAVATNEDYAKRAADLGHSILSSCEHGTPGNYRECAELAEKYGLHWRYVCEAYFVKDRNPELKDKANCHMILAAKTEKGIGDLNEVMSEANLTGFHYRARIDLDLLMKLDPKDVFVTTACVAGVWAYGMEEAERLIRTIHGHFGDSFMIEVQPHHTDKQREVNRFALSLYHKYGIPLIAGMDSHYIMPGDSVLRDDYLASGGLHYADEDGWFMDYPDDDTAYRRFVDQGVLPESVILEALGNTNIFLTFEDVTFDHSRKLPTLFPDLTQEQRNEMYRALIRKKWLEKRPGIPQEQWDTYQKGIAYEVDTITSTNMSDYFLLDYELVRRGLELGGQLTYTGRGSAPSYYTNTLLGFSSIDRFALPVTMYPDRFISADRLASGSTPDIDNNVSDQAPFYQAQKELLGEWGSAPMLAYGTMKRLAAWKMYCRANNVPFDTANEISDALKKYELALKHAAEDEQVDVMDYVPAMYADELKGSEQYIGLIDHVSPHPCAYVLTGRDVRREFGIIRTSAKTGSKEPVYCAFIDGAQADKYGYLKNDWLVVTVVKLIRDIYDRIGLPQPTVPELLNLVDHDKPTWDLYAKGCTLGLNQVEREKSREKTMRYKPKNLTELSALVAGLRPAFQSMLDIFLDRKHFDYGIPVLDRLLQTKEMPNSFILYQEQMMTVLQYGGFTASESYAAIKAIAKKHPEKVLPLKERFCEAFSKRLVDEENTAPEKAEETTAKVWQILSDSCSYGFNSCLTGDTKIFRAINKKDGFSPTIAEMYAIRNDKTYAVKTGHKDLHEKYRYYGYGKAMSLCEDGRIRENRIVDIREQGIRDIYTITTNSGASVRCTANHKFPVVGQKEMLRADELHNGMRLFFLGDYEHTTRRHGYTNGDFTPNTPKKGQQGFQKKPNGASVIFSSFRKNKIEERCPCEECGTPYSEEACFELHHIDNDPTNNCADNYLWLCNSCHKAIHYRALGRTKRYQKGIPSYTEEIVSIVYSGKEMVYDVEMEAPNHNFCLDNRMVVGNSHAVAVALDSLYCAWAKAHYPYEYYAALLTNYSERGDKDKIALARAEMKTYFGIDMKLPKFRQDNRSYYINPADRSISDVISSAKGMSARFAEDLWALRDNQYATFTDLLADLTENTCLTKSAIETLIRIDYFEEFGKGGKLLAVLSEFISGDARYSKNHAESTKEKRLAALREKEKSIPEVAINSLDVLRFELDTYGIPLSVFPERGLFMVMDIDTAYSPKITLYNCSAGTQGVMKTKKDVFKNNPLKRGDFIRLGKWTKREACSYKDGKRVPKPGVYEFWLDDWKIISSEA